MMSTASQLYYSAGRVHTSFLSSLSVYPHIPLHPLRGPCPPDPLSCMVRPSHLRVTREPCQSGF
ncbi:hypothetical protein BJV77DRAFT_1020233 [Russula vinacea]|nr:hypothetical protein BJV77DRAFT_1020233 [Russula vinacea]